MEPTNKLASDKFYNMKTYSASVKELSAMLVKARKSSLPEWTPCSVPMSTNEKSRINFKKSYTCGSLFVKCACKNDVSLFNRTSIPFKRNSNPTYSPTYTKTKNKIVFKYNNNNNNNNDNNNDNNNNNNNNNNNSKLLFNSESNKNKSNKSTDSKTLIKSNIYLNHPEITFPIPIEIPKNFKNLEKSSSNYKLSNLNYHKYTVLSYESYTVENEKARKFLTDFGIIGSSMGNGITSFQKNAKTSFDDGTVQCIGNSCTTIKDKIKKKNSFISIEDYEYIKSVNISLKNELAEIEIKYETLQNELFDIKQYLEIKEKETNKLQREVHKLKSVLQQTSTFNQDILTSLQEQHAMANRMLQNQQQSFNTNTISKKQGVSAESTEATDQVSDLTKFEKDFRSKQLIKDAIMDNDFLNKLDISQVREIVDCMYSKDYPAGSYVTEEGESGAHLFVSAEGEFQVIKDGNILSRMGPGKAFGELAILYNCTRTASIRVDVDSKVWVLDRKVFQQIMVRTGLQRLQDNISFLRSVALLQKLSNEVLAKIADALEVEFHPADDYIIRQGGSGDTFFIISNGSVKVTQRVPGSLEEIEIRTLHRGDYFGEQALLKEECRSASIIALHPGVECLTLDRDSFKNLIGDLCEIKEKDYGDEERLRKSLININLDKEYEYIQLNDLEIISTLGIGGFGRVELVQYIKDSSLTFALKCLKKQHIVDTQQQDHVYSEKNIMISCRSPFICKMYKTFRDTKYVYMLLEVCLGGEVWTILREKGSFDEYTTKFITACVLEAFDYLHNRGIIYRDLKPENLLLDNKGYVKLVDFGFSKKIELSSKTWTFCGTPEYVAPETILNKGHDKAVDFWALGILMYELLNGNPPFTDADPMKTYNLILKGVGMIDFSKHTVGKTAQSLIKKLCKVSPVDRLGCQKGGIQDIKKHKWYQSFDWDGLIELTLESPIKQIVKSPFDTSNFDCFTKDNETPLEETSGWDENF